MDSLLWVIEKGDLAKLGGGSRLVSGCEDSCKAEVRHLT